jgi:dienelactone hydrolase
MNWADGEPFAPKFERLLGAIDKAAAQGPVALVGSSAGAGAVINAYAQRPNIRGAVCIAGKINNPQTIGQAYKQQNPAFWESAQLVPNSLTSLRTTERKRILSVYAPQDGVVPPEDSRVTGAHNRQVRNKLHPIVIGTQLVFGAPKWLWFLRHIDKQA